MSSAADRLPILEGQQEAIIETNRNSYQDGKQVYEWEESDLEHNLKIEVDQKEQIFCVIKYFK
jgi:hypothetical protein